MRRLALRRRALATRHLGLALLLAAAGPLASVGSSGRPGALAAIARLASPSIAHAQAQPAMPVVIVYGVAWCLGCRNARAFFSARTDVVFRYVDVEANAANQRSYESALRRARASGVPANGYPIIEIPEARGRRFFVGFDADEMARVLPRGTGRA